MGKRGPPLKPTALKVIQGTYRPDRAVSDEMSPTLGPPLCPEYLDDGARAEWDRVVPELDRLGVIAKIDGAAIEGYCANYSLAKWYHRVAAKVPMVRTKDGPAPNPASAAARHHWLLAKQFLVEFGLTPASRGRVSQNPQSTEHRLDKFKTYPGKG